MENPIPNILKIDKRKFLFIGLIGLLLVFFFLLLSNIAAKQALMREYTSVKDKLTKENEALLKRINATLEDKKHLEEKLSSAEKDLDRVYKEKDDIQRKFELITRELKEKEEYIEKLKEKKPAAEEVKVAPLPEDAYWAKILKDKTNLEIQLASLKTNLENLKIDLEDAKRNKITMELEIQNLTRNNQSLENKMVYNEKLTDTLSSELVREKNNKRKLEDELKALKSEHNVLLRQLRSLNSQKTALETRLKETERAKTELDKRIKEMTESLELKLSEMMDVKKDLQQIQEGTQQIQEEAQFSPPASKSSIELPPIIVRSTPEVSPAQYAGKVLAVNRENNFIIIDLGEEQGIKPQTSFSVYRDNNKIATVEVMQVRKNVSACDIKQASGLIDVGDEVR